jgi:DNA-binding NtrC family response regulator
MPPLGQQRGTGSAITWAGRRILLVEDDAIIGLDIRDILERAGCLMLGPAANVSDALAVITSTKIDGAVLDINLGGELSYGVADALAAKSIPFMIISGYSADRVPAAHRQRPILAKPFLAHELLAAFGRAIAA